MAEISSPTGAHVEQLSPLQLPNDRQLVLRVMPLPADANGNGDIFGGWIMAQVDLAGAVLPARIAKGRIATVAVNQFVFKQPVSIGDLLSFYARVERIGTTSVTVHESRSSHAAPSSDTCVQPPDSSQVSWVQLSSSSHASGSATHTSAMHASWA